ncbi:MAG TPA: 2-oxoacid:acceptor oxidoreductase family protein [Thermodesulfobacteriota bacterium]|nr:2-oxoacid:acceptor oxidoreductase family protein [Deltaproteobacteria bacterium]HNR14340.1 2-oxoacid:acceptor oxidoreductase family protein [Thermodesulfobacteriota bacterium]HNU72648.1 2-oxoacid:acceptor oxidoreductase family protein [Thermodesulfobacteriota bacterium]HQO77956.1 2-oxoacid:acceptor oxidoreductase family protein [Thermodesulfobacteriota bacterium]
MLIKTVFAGFGGQGVLSMGLNLAQAAMLEGKHVTYLPAYGAEVRGGTANCTVSVSDEEIASPVASSPTFIVALNQPSVVRFQNKIQSGGVMFLNSSLIKEPPHRFDIEVVGVPANAIAENMGSIKSANMILLGAFIKKSNLVSLHSLIEGLAVALKGKKKLIKTNSDALAAGYELI